MKKIWISLCIAIVIILALSSCDCNSCFGDKDREDKIVIDSITAITPTITIDVGTTSSVEVSVLPEEAREKYLRFKSSDESIVSVDERTGEITAISEGTAVITAYSKENKKINAECTVTVIPHEHLMGDPFEENRVESTCAKAGSYDKVYYCAYKNCGQEISREKVVIKKKLHNYVDYTCTACNQVASEGLEYRFDGEFCEVVGLGTCKDQHIVIPDTYEGATVHYVKFYGGDHIKSISIPATVIGMEVSLHNIENYYVEESNDTLYSVDGVLFYSWNGSKELLAYPEGRTDKTYTIPEGTNIIQSKAFSYSKLTSITIPDSVTEIRQYAFTGCSRLGEVVIGDSVKTIGESAFDGCTSLTKLTLGSSVKEIVANAFTYCKNLVEIVNKSSLNIEAGSTEHGEIARYAISVKSSDGISIVDNVNGFLFTKKGEDYYLIGYRGEGPSVVLPDTYNGHNYYISEGAFDNRNDIVSLTVGSGVKNISLDCFYSERLVEIVNRSELNIYNGDEGASGDIFMYALDIHSGSSKLQTYGDFLFYNYMGENYLVGYEGESRNVVLPDYYNGATYKIYYHAFYRNKSIESVVIGAGVTEIGQSAFEDCSLLTSLTIKDGLIDIGYSAFSYCSIIELSIPDSVKYIRAGAFSDNKLLSNVAIGAGTVEIETSVFRSCDNLRYLTVSSLNNHFATVNDILYTKDGKVLISYPGGKQDETFTVPLGVELIESHAFENNKYLKHLIISDTVKETKWSAFSGCENLETVVVGASVTMLNNGAFNYCKSLTDIVIKTTSLTIGSSVFNQTTNLKNIYFAGTEWQWKNSVHIDDYGNEKILDITLHYKTTEIK